MARALLLVALVAGLGTPASAKIICTPGQFRVRAVDAANAPAPLRDGMMLELGAGRAALSGVCAAVRAASFHRGLGRWTRVKARWTRCERLRPVALRARFDTGDGAYCRGFTGTLRLGGRSFAVVGERVPACGNELREIGEQCDGTDSTGLGGECCAEDCTVKPGCAMHCDAERFPCAAHEICAYPCGGRGMCRPREDVACDFGPVCACDRATTFADVCAAFAAGTGVAYFGACQPPPPAAPPRR